MKKFPNHGLSLMNADILFAPSAQILSLVQKVRISWERGHPARGWLRKTRKMRAGCPRSQGISTRYSIARAFCTGIKY
jgi:hypothetical protein